MTDLDTLRQALRAAPGSPEFGHDDLDIAVIVKRGRRMRARRRLAVAGGVACLAAVAFGLTAGLGHSAGPSVPAVGPGRSAPARIHHGTVPRRPSTPSISPETPSPTASAVPPGASATPTAISSPYAPGVSASDGPTPIRSFATVSTPATNPATNPATSSATASAFMPPTPTP